MENEFKKYIDLRITSLKLSLADGLSAVFNSIIAALMALVMAVIIIAFVGLAIMQILNKTLGEPWGTLITVGIMAVIMLIVILFRKKLLRKVLEGAFSSALGVKTDDLKSDLAQVNEQIRMANEDFVGRYNNLVSGISYGAFLTNKIINIIRKFASRK